MLDSAITSEPSRQYETNTEPSVLRNKQRCVEKQKSQIPFQNWGVKVSPPGGTQVYKWRGCTKPFFGFEICDLRTFLGLKFCSDFFWVRDFGKDFFGGWQKAKTRVLVFMSNNCIMTQKLSGILLNYYYYFCLIGLFWVTFWAVGLFWVRV